MNMAVLTALQSIGSKRDALLQQLTKALEADTRVKAVWLSGSFGRGEADEWSDLDLHVVINDDDFSWLIAEPTELFQLAGEPLLILSLSGHSNSMPGGYFWLVMYHDALEIDWNIGPLTEAIRPEASEVLFDRSGIPVAPPPVAITMQERVAQAAHSLNFFWAMIPIAIKYTGRGHTRLAVHQIELLETAYKTVWRAIWRPELLHNSQYHQNRRLEAELDEKLPRLGPQISPILALEHINLLSKAMTDLEPALTKFGVKMPAQLIKEVEILTELTRLIAKDGGSRPYQGTRR